jgi:hypothetical protein
VANFVILLSLLIVLNFIHNSLVLLQRKDSLLTSKIGVSEKLLILAVFRKRHVINLYPEGLLWSPLVHSAVNCPNPETNSICISNRSVGIGLVESNHCVSLAVEYWSPLRIPLIPVLTVSLVISLVLGDLLLYLVA